MSVTDTLPDAGAREEALDPSRSFIVQAPAGSGKTELLIRRYLRLLARVEQPEEVVAVTFTLKAAGEMRARVATAIRQAAAGARPAEPHMGRAYDLAREVITDERRRGWHLDRHPSRLRIGTIDALNAWLAGRAPLGAGSGALGRVTDTPESLYREAARWTLALVADDEHGRPVAALLRHLDNDAARFERLVVAMLPRRDQWLRHLAGAEEDRETFERPLRDLIDHVLGLAAADIDADTAAELAALARFADVTFRTNGRESIVPAWHDRDGFPAAHHHELAAWREMTRLVLTGAGQWRQSIDVRQGFPPGSVGSSRVDLQACKLEYSIVSPK